jgi:60 kDa SS-A/Ro ribonucleoprotein
MRKNYGVTSQPIYNHGGSISSRFTPEQELRRTVMSCMLWEDNFYENGERVADRIAKLIEQVPLPVAVRIAREASQKMYLRHVPLFMTALIAKYHSGPKGQKNVPTPPSSAGMISELVTDVVTRVDSIMELISLIGTVNNLPLKRKSGDTTTKTVRKALSAQIRKGLAKAFLKFDEYQFAKYQQNNSNLAVSLKDAYFLVHPQDRGTNAEQRELYNKIVGWKKDKKWEKKVGKNKDKIRDLELQEKIALSVPNTWEARLSAGENSKEVFTNLLQEEKLGYMALLRNLRNMQKAEVDENLIRDAILKRKGAHRVLPFRYLKAAQFAPGMFQEIDTSFKACIENLPKLPGKTLAMIDVSGSMIGDKVSEKSDMDRLDAAATLAAVIPSDRLDIYTFSSKCVQVPTIRGLALIDRIKTSQVNGSTQLGHALSSIDASKYDRIIIVTDEQATDRVVLPPVANGYVINVGVYQNGLQYKKNWIAISGFSENVFAYIHEYEKSDLRD